MTDASSAVIAPRSLRRISGVRHTATLVGLSAVMLLPGHALAQVKEDDVPLATIAVEEIAIDPNPNAQLGVPFKARTSGDERRSRPIAETPATITVLTRAQLEQSGYTDLTRILDSQPGVTVGTGENGNAFGDRYVIRGQDVKSDVFVDGLRDPGLQTRESFAIEQLEITKGPSSSFAGRGASGGAVNAITKAATTDYNFARADVGIGSDNYIRTTADVNYALGDKLAVRINGLYADTDVPYRSPSDRTRYGAAVSALFAPTPDLKIILDYYVLRARDKPDIGSYSIALPDGTRTPGPLGPSYVQKSDFQNSDVDTWTARIKWNLADNLRLSNSFRYGKTYNAYVVHGTSSRVVPTSTGTPPATSYQTSIIDGGHVGWQDLKYIANQTNLSADLDLLGAKHQFILGVEYTNHKVQSTNGTGGATGAFVITTPPGRFNCPSVFNGPNNGFCITDANGNAVPDLENLTGRTVVRTPFAARRWKIETISAYLMDTVDLTSALTLFAGVRLDRYDFNISAHNTLTGAQTSAYEYSDTLWNGHLGLTYKVGGGGMFYATVSTAADINGGESDTTGAGYGGFINPATDGVVAKPERSWNFEVGTKWNVLDEKLLLTGALFRTVKSDVMEGANYDTFGTFNTGKNRVQGFEFSIAGNITDAWSVQGGFTLMRAKVLESVTPANVGRTLANFANNSLQFMTRYAITDKLAIGGAIKYKSERYGGQPDTGAPVVAGSVAPNFVYSQTVPSYVVADLSADFHVTSNIELRLNVNNLFNKDYYLAAYRANGTFLYLGDKRQIVGTISAKF